MLPQVSSFFAKIPLNDHLWDLLETYSKTEEARSLPPVKKRALNETMESFRQAGADLPPDKKKRLEELESELSQATQKYSENVLDSTNAWELIVTDLERLKGLPQTAIDAAKADAAVSLHTEGTVHDPGHGIRRRRKPPPSCLGRHHGYWSW
jgi:oligopeptidase A